jgi:hypothetical protein
MRTLPRTKASPAFTREVMRALHRGEERRPLFWRMAAAFAMTACLVAIVHVAVMQHRRHEQTLALRAERQKLATELEAVKKIARDVEEPMVVLENDAGTRVIMDLDSAAIQPASLRNYD